MDPRLNAACCSGDVTTVVNLYQENTNILAQTTNLQNTPLHIAARFGHLELAKLLIKLRPSMLLAENREMETPLYEACREGHHKVAHLLYEVEYSVAFKVNRDKESVLFVACDCGHLDVVKLFLEKVVLRFDRTSYLHVAASHGFTAIVQEILKIEPKLALRKDERGFSPLHFASRKGHLETTRELLTANTDLCFLKDNNGRTPLHLAAISGQVNVINEIVSASPESALMQTQLGETVLHLSVMHNQYEAVNCLMVKLCIINLINLPDINGNTALHQAAIGKLSDITKLLLSQNKADVKAVNKNGLTVLDILKEGPTDAEDTEIIQMLNPPKHDNNSVSLQPSDNKLDNNSVRLQPSDESQSGNSSSKLGSLTNDISGRQIIYMAVAMLIATVTFQAGLNPPPCQDWTGNPMTNSIKAIHSEVDNCNWDQASYKYFMASNTMGFFLSTNLIILIIFCQSRVLPFMNAVMAGAIISMETAFWYRPSVFMEKNPFGSGLSFYPLVVVCFGFLCIWVGWRLTEFEKEKKKKKKEEENSHG
ncbi:uncharacterized protein LOC143860285 [Tasmannia lanceolata]|uniref:uncharacterized protein LOC143860285 n=1 Tax=Tasmannia lanceolata TaxID=3420 RepID=UPI0040635EE0